MHTYNVMLLVLWSLKGITKFWYGVMNLVQINILEAYAFLHYSLIVVPVEIESKVIINNKLFMLYSSLSRSRYQFSYKTMFLD